MSVTARPCDPARIHDFLDHRMSEFEEADFEAHLSECAACRLGLAATTAPDDLWDKASRYLRYDDDEPGCSSGTNVSPARHDRSHAIQQVLDSLQPTDDPEMLGRLGGHEVSGVVGAGAMGIVLKAFDKSLDRTVAIKVLAPHLASSGAARKRFAREAKAAAAVLHPNVMAIHSVSSDEALPYLVMPYVGGSSLRKRLDAEGPLPVSEVLRIGSQIAAGLAAAHAQGLVHRDIKPANMLLENGVERVAITDFGLARAVDDATMTCTGVIAGTPQYMSPEQARGENIDQRSDLFSLGSVIYTMCTGRPPFRAETSYGILRRITDTEPRPIREISPDIPAWLCAIIAKLMSKQPNDRFASAGEVAELLEDCLAHVQQPTVVPLPTGAEQLSQLLTPGNDTHQPDRASGRFAWKSRASGLRLLIGAAFASALVLAGILVVLELNKGKLIIESEFDNVTVRITKSGEDVNRLTLTRSGTSVRLAAGTYLVTLDGAYDGITIDGGTVTLQRGGRQVVRITETREPEADPATDAGSRRPSSADKPTPRAGVRRLEVWAMDEDGRNVRRVADCGEYTIINSPEVSPDGKFVAVDGWRADQNLRDAHVLIIDVETGKTTDLCKGAMPTWSPDGKWISFCKYGSERGVYIRALDVGAERLLDRDGWGIQWSPDGLKAAYSRGGRLVVHNFVSDTERVIDPADWDYTYIYWNTTWSPDSKQICFKARRSHGQAEFAIVGVEGDMATVRRRIDATNFHEDIAWHPGGSRILIPRRPVNGERAQICEFDPDGAGDPVPVKGQPKDRNQAGMCWTRDGKTLYFISQVIPEPRDAAQPAEGQSAAGPRDPSPHPPIPGPTPTPKKRRITFHHDGTIVLQPNPNENSSVLMDLSRLDFVVNQLVTPNDEVQLDVKPGAKQSDIVSVVAALKARGANVVVTVVDDRNSDEFDAAHKLRETLRLRLKLTQTAFASGFAALTDVLTAAKELAEAEVAAAGSVDEKKEARRRQVDLLKQLQVTVKQRYQAGIVDQADVLALEAELLKAEAELKGIRVDP